MTRDESTLATPHEDVPPFEAFYVVEVDVDRERDNSLYASIRGPFPSREKAEHERDEQQKAWNRALDERDGGNPYDFKGWDIVEKHLSDHQVHQLDRQDQESYEITMDAVNAVGASLLAEEGIGPLTEDDE